MDWSAGYRCRVEAALVDGATWHDRGALGEVLSFSCTRSLQGGAPAVDAGDMELSGEAPDGAVVRVWASAEAGGARARAALGTFVARATARAGVPGRGRLELSLGSVLAPAAEAPLAVGECVPEGADAPLAAAALLSGALAAPVVVAGGDRPRLASAVVAGGDTRLSMAWAVLSACGWELATDALGRAVVRPRPSEPVTVRARDVVGEVRVAPGEAGDEAEYRREWVEGVGPGDLVRLPGLAGAWRVATQALSSGAGVTVAETAVREVAGC